MTAHVSHSNTEEGEMNVSRRSFVQSVGMGTTAAFIMSFDGPRAWARAASLKLPVQDRPILLHNNENPLGPGARVVSAMNAALEGGPRAGRYPGGASRVLAETIAKENDLPVEYVMVGNGSTQLLRTATQVFTSRTRPLVTGEPSYEEAPGYAALIENPVVAVPLDANMKLDLGGMADATKGAGLVFVNNPNNPTSTLHTGDALGAFIDRVLSETDAMILVDEAYHEYVTDPSYESQLSRAVQEERLIVTRTFSKAYGMAGMRIGWAVAHPDAITKMRDWHYGLSLNIPSLIGATTAAQDRDRIAEESERNREARRFTADWFTTRGFAVADSQTNFIFANTGMPASDFRAACAEHSVLVGRDFPPFEAEWSRISIGTMDEMRRAVGVFDGVLAETTMVPSRGRDRSDAA